MTNRKQMESTIGTISERLAGVDTDKLEREAATLSQQRARLILRQLREARQKNFSRARGEAEI